MDQKEALIKYCLRLGDNAMILGHRMSQWSSKGPILEEDIAMSNIGLDLFGQCRMMFSYAAEVEGQGKTEDDWAYKRPEREFYNVILAEQPNGHFGTTIARQLLFSLWANFMYRELMSSNDQTIAAFATKSIKEIKYHLRHASQWLIRLGDGTPESHQKMQEGLSSLWSYRHELFDIDEVDETLIAAAIAVDPNQFKEEYENRLKELIAEATLQIPEEGYRAKGGKEGIHSEHLGHILSEFQYLVRAYPDAKW